MKNKRIIKLLVLMMIFYTRVALGNNFENNISFNQLTVQDGLSQLSINDIFQDSNGYMWFATEDGLNKYDGEVFEVYKYGINEEKSLSYSRITCINEDSKENLWIGTKDGLNRIDKNNDDIEIYTEGNLSNKVITDVFIDNEGKILVLTQDGINLYDESLNSFERILYSEEEEILTSQVIRKIVQDSKGIYWIVTDNGINVYDKENNEIEKFLFAEVSENDISMEYISDIHIDEDYKLWIATAGEGIRVVDINTREVIDYKHNPENRKSIISDYTTTIIEDHKGRVWIGTKSGLSLFDKNTKEFHTYQHEIYDKTTLNSNNILSIFEDNLGMIWVGTDKGINMFNPDSIFKVYKNDPFNENSLSDNYIFGIYEDSDGLLWVGTYRGGVNVIDRDNDIIYRLNEEIEDKTIFTSSFVTDIDGIGNKIWISTTEELVLIDKESGDVTKFFQDNNLNIREIYIDDNEEAWIGTKETIYRIDSNYSIIDYTYIFDRVKEDNIYVRALLKDSNDILWIGLDGNGGVIKYDEANDTIKQYKSTKDDKSALSYNSVKDIKEDLEGNIWIASDSGLNKYNKIEDNFTVFTEKDGLSNNFIYGILVDYDNNLWLSTNNGISKYNQDTDTFINFKVEDGLQGNEFNSNAYFKSDKGEMFFGGIDGLNSFYPEEFNEINIKVELKLDNVKISGKNVEYNDKIILDYYDDNIEFEFFLADYRNSNKTIYAYKLEGVDSEWQYESDERDISYENLEPGDYSLLISAQNSYGKWTDTIKIEISKKIEPWKTKAAYASYIISAIIIISSIWNKGKIVNLLVKLKTDELNDKLIENSLIYKKNIDNEVNKNNYFVNLSHELRTPLNVMLATESLIEGLNKREKHIEKDKLDYYMSILRKNSNRLLKLINNIIDTSKIESGTYELVIRESDIIYHIEDISLSMKDYIEGKGINFVIDPLVEEKFIECDINEIEKCVVNLISNATKFTKPGGTIEIIIEEEGNSVKIKVKDSGVGIKEDDLNKIFERFGQAENRDNALIKGSGIGLFLTKQIVELHNGELRVESEFGKGSTFTIVLPTKYVKNNEKISAEKKEVINN